MDSNSTWTAKQNKLFEDALVVLGGGISPELWWRVARAVGGKTAEEAKRHYEMLVEDVEQIESGHVPLPRYKPAGEKAFDFIDEQERLKHMKLE
ncbi:protein RADIALIS-like 4 [Diospyros lotus]|uniref:protein RADIALIS-like 4 n=1 Tax=Diospyros lotus TaxID=55363 RepID=UPI00225352A3|nr:protein RADIALIS-like 4 [Diospyros lotus]